MIYTLLYSSKLLNNNKYRNTLIYAIGTIFYTIIHWLLFSTIGNNNIYIQKYRYLLYFIVAGDLVYVGNKYRESWDMANICNQTIHNSKIEIDEQDTKNPSNCHNGLCVLPKKSKHLENEKSSHHESNTDNHSTTSKPKEVKNDNIVHNDHIVHNDRHDIKSEDTISLPVYKSIENDVHMMQNKNIQQEQESTYIPTYTQQKIGNEHVKEVINDERRESNDNKKDDVKDNKKDDMKDNKKDDEKDKIKEQNEETNEHVISTSKSMVKKQD